jgi:hypothetical protein
MMRDRSYIALRLARRSPENKPQRPDVTGQTLTAVRRARRRTPPVVDCDS